MIAVLVHFVLPWAVSIRGTNAFTVQVLGLLSIFLLKGGSKFSFLDWLDQLGISLVLMFCS